MKKWLILILSLLLLASACAESAPFTFRGDIRWGMSREAVLMAEGDPAYETDREKGMEAVILSDATFEDAPCTVIYLFMDDQLAMARFEYDTTTEGVAFDRLAERLTGRLNEIYAERQGFSAEDTSTSAPAASMAESSLAACSFPPGGSPGHGRTGSAALRGRTAVFHRRHCAHRRQGMILLPSGKTQNRR